MLLTSPLQTGADFTGVAIALRRCSATESDPEARHIARRERDNFADLIIFCFFSAWKRKKRKNPQALLPHIHFFHLSSLNPHIHILSGM